jgi:hypothetical protein
VRAGQQDDLSHFRIAPSRNDRSHGGIIVRACAAVRVTAPVYDDDALAALLVLTQTRDGCGDAVLNGAQLQNKKGAPVLRTGAPSCDAYARCE